MKRLRRSTTYSYLMGVLFGFILGRTHDWDQTPHGWNWIFAILPIVILVVFWFYLRHQMKKGTP